jgi:hypothetical protein
MFGGISGFYLGLAGLEALVVLAVCLWSLTGKGIDLDRRRVVLLGILWVLVLTVEYWAAGPLSFSQINDEGELTAPFYKLLAEHFAGGQYLHGLGGGLDVIAGMGYATSILSVERSLFALLPSWQAMAVHKIMAAITAFIGAYLLARRGGGADRRTAFALAAFHTVAHRYMINASLFQGIELQLAPLAVYLVVFRTRRRFYWLGVTALAVLHAASSAVFHMSLAFGFAITLIWAMTGFAHPLRVLPALGAIMMASALNWSEVIFALLQTSSSSSLTLREVGGESAGAFTKYFLERSPQTAILILAVLVWLGVSGSRPRLGLALSGLFVAWGVGPVLLSLPWAAWNIKVLQGYDWFYLSFAIPSVLILAAAWAAPKIPPSGWRRMVSPAVLFLAFGVSGMAWAKVYNTAQWLGFGGQMPYSQYTNLAQPDWLDPAPARVVSVPYRLNPNTTAAYGLDSFDAFVSNYPTGHSLFWRYGICGGSEDCPWLMQAYVTTQTAMDFLCCESYPIQRVIRDQDALRVGNVGYVLSVLPIEGLTQVSGPTGPLALPRRGAGFFARFQGLLADLRHPQGVRVYRIDGAVEKAFIAAESRIYPPELSSAQRVQAAIQAALKHVALSDSALPPARPGTVGLIQPVRDGYDIQVDLPQGGILMVNASWTPYWQAEAGGQTLSVTEANLIHTAIAVPPYRGVVHLRHHRPMLRDRLGLEVGFGY